MHHPIELGWSQDPLIIITVIKPKVNVDESNEHNMLDLLVQMVFILNVLFNNRLQHNFIIYSIFKKISCIGV